MQGKAGTVVTLAELDGRAGEELDDRCKRASAARAGGSHPATAMSSRAACERRYASISLHRALSPAS